MQLLSNIYIIIAQHISTLRNIWNNITQRMILFYNYITYTEFLHNIVLVYYATYKIIVHNKWFYCIITQDTQNSYMTCQYTTQHITQHMVSFWLQTLSYVLIPLCICCTIFFVVCRYHIFSCLTTHILSTQHFCQTTRVNTSTRGTVLVTVNESSVQSNVSCYTRTLCVV